VFCEDELRALLFKKMQRRAARSVCENVEVKMDVSSSWIQVGHEVNVCEYAAGRETSGVHMSQHIALDQNGRKASYMSK